MSDKISFSDCTNPFKNDRNDKQNNKKVSSIIFLMIMTFPLIFGFAGYGIGIFNYSTEYQRGYDAGFILGNSTGWESGNSSGWDDGWIEGNSTGWDDGWLEGNSSGYIAGFSIGYDIAYDLGYDQGYLDAFLENQIRFIGYSNGNITIYNSDQNTSQYTESFSDIKNSEIFSIETYENETASINATISDIKLYNSTIIQDTFIQTNSQSLYTATSSLQLYQCLTITENLNLTSITLIGTTTGNARLRIRLYQNNNGVVGSLITTLRTDSIARPNGLQTIIIRFSYPLSIGCYFIGIQTTVGSFRISTSYGTGVNDYVTLYGSSLANIDYAINYTIAPPNYYQLSSFIDIGILNANNIGSFVSLPFINYNSHIDSFALRFGSIDMKIMWNWFNLTFDIEFNVTFGIDTELTENCTLIVDSLALRNNQSTNFWGYNQNGEITADITYYTQTDILCWNFGVTINGYSFRFDLIEPAVFKKGFEYNFEIINMNATIFDVIGTTWICDFQMEYIVNGTLLYEEINDLYIFDVFRE